MWEEGLRVALRCLTETPFTGHAGQYVTMPPRNVVPKPRQKPHPPVWVACSRRDTIHLAAQHGIGALAFAFIDPEEARHWVDRLLRRRSPAECVPIGDAVNPNVACVTTVHVPRRRAGGAARAGSRARTSSGTRSRTTTCSVVTAPGAPTSGPSTSSGAREQGYDPEAVEAAARDGDRLGAKVVQEGGFFGLRGAIGTPDQVRDYLRRYEDVRRRPGDLLQPGGQEPPRAHHGEPRALRHARCCRSSSSATSAAQREKATRLEPVVDGRAGAQAGRRTTRRSRPTTTRSPRSRAGSPTAPAATTFHQWLDDFAEQTALGGAPRSSSDLLG